nr:flagellin [Niallia circulans]
MFEVTFRQLNSASNAQSKSMEKLSSGLRINKAGDDAAGLAISEKMRGQIRGLDQASKNAQDGISMIQTAEGALNETHDILQRMKELATQAANGTNTESDRGEIQKEINQLTSEVNRIGNTTEFNTQKLLDGGADANKTALGSNEAKGVAASGANVTSVKAATAVAASGDLTAADSAIWVGEAGTGVKFSLNTGSKNEDALTAYSGGSSNTAADFKSLLENLTDESGLVKFGDLVDVNVSDSGIVSFTTKATGTDAKIAISNEAGNDVAAAGTLTELGLAATLAEDDTFVGTAGTIATVTGNDIANSFGADANKINVDSAKGKQLDVTVNGETYKVTLDNTAINVASGLASDNSDDGMAASLNSALARAVDKDGNTVDLSTKVDVTASSDKLSFALKPAAVPADGATPSIKVAGDYASTLLGGITDGKNEVGGTFTTKFQIGANNGQSFQMDIQDMRAQALNISGTISGGSNEAVSGAKFTATTTVTNGTNNDAVEYALDVSTHESATAAIEVLDNAIQSVSAQRSQLGAYQNRLDHTINNLNTSSENLTAAESRIRDVDYALAA